MQTSRSTRRGAGALAASLVCLVAQVAGAAPGPLRVTPSTVPEGTPSADEKQLEASLKSGLDRVEIETTEDEGAPTVHMTITAEEADYIVLLEVDDGGRTIAQADVECELCGVAELNESIAAAASRLRQRLDLTGEAVNLVVRTEPGAAEVYVDGESAGKTPVGTSVPAGPHDLRIEREGYRPIKTRFEATGGSDSTFEYAMRPRTYRVAVPWTLIGVGAALVGGGAALVAVHGNEIQGDCNADVMGNCEFVRRTRPGGITAITVGATAMVTGAVLAVLWRRARRKDYSDTARSWRWRGTL